MKRFLIFTLVCVLILIGSTSIYAGGGKEEEVKGEEILSVTTKMLTVATFSIADNFDPLTSSGDAFRNVVRLALYNTLMAYDSDTNLRSVAC